MLKLISGTAPAAARKRSRRCEVQRELGALAVAVEKTQALGEATQRAVARGRGTIVDAQRGVQKARRESVAPVRDGATDPAADGCVEDLTRQLTDIHQRLLLFSSSVELEMDRLEMLRAEIEDSLARRRESPR